MADVEIYVNCGHYAVRNGAVNPIRQVFDIRDLTDVSLIMDSGTHYGHDYFLCLDQTEVDNVISLLKDAKIPYSIHRKGEARQQWENLSEELMKERDQQNVVK